MQNLVTCQYETKLAGLCRQVTVTWIRSAGEQGLCVTVDDPSCRYTCKVKMKTWSFWKKSGVKSFEVGGEKIEVFWDLSTAKYSIGPEPKQGFYVAVVCNVEIVLLLGDKTKEALKQTKARPSSIEATLISRKKHVFGRNVFCTKAQFGESAKTHDIVIECHTDPTPPSSSSSSSSSSSASRDPYLLISVDSQSVVQVKNLEWKFRGNQTVLLDGMPLEIFWDVHNWVFNSASSGKKNSNNAIFIFRASDDESPEKSAGIGKTTDAMKWSGSLNGHISVMKLAGTRSLTSAHDLSDMTGSALMLHAWRSE